MFPSDQATFFSLGLIKKDGWVTHPKFGKARSPTCLWQVGGRAIFLMACYLLIFTISPILQIIW